MTASLEVHRRRLFGLAADAERVAGRLRAAGAGGSDPGGCDQGGGETSGASRGPTVLSALAQTETRWRVKTESEAHRWAEFAAMVSYFGENLSAVDDDVADTLNTLR